MSGERECVKCGRVLPLIDFYPYSAGKFGRQPDCKECRKAAAREYRKTIPLHEPITVGDKTCGKCCGVFPVAAFHIDSKRLDGRVAYCPACVAENGERWRKSHPDKKTAMDRAYHLAHVQEHRNRSKEWVASNPSRAKETQRRLYLENRELRCAQTKAWMLAHPDMRKAQHVRSKAARRKRESVAAGSFSGKEWNALVTAFDGRCVCCGNAPKIMTADHIIPISRGGDNNIENIQPLCNSCNASKLTKSTSRVLTPGRINAATSSSTVR